MHNDPKQSIFNSTRVNSTLDFQGFVAAIISPAMPPELSWRPQTQSPARNQMRKETIVTTHARGAFDVMITPQAQDDKSAVATVRRYSFDKQFHGDFDGQGAGVMYQPKRVLNMLV